MEDVDVKSWCVSELLNKRIRPIVDGREVVVVEGGRFGSHELDLILCRHHVRKLTKDLAVCFRCREYHVTGQRRGYRLLGTAVPVCEGFDGSVLVLHDEPALTVGCEA